MLNYSWTAMSAGISLSRSSDGSVRERSHQPGDTAYYRYGPGEFRFHDLENVGSSELVFAIVENLDSANPPLAVIGEPPQVVGRRADPA